MSQGFWGGHMGCYGKVALVFFSSFPPWNLDCSKVSNDGFHTWPCGRRAGGPIVLARYDRNRSFFLFRWYGWWRFNLEPKMRCIKLCKREKSWNTNQLHTIWDSNGAYVKLVFFDTQVFSKFPSMQWLHFYLSWPSTTYDSGRSHK